MVHYISIDTQKNDCKLYDTFTNRTTNVVFENGQGARSYLRDYINKHRIKPITIYQAELPNKTQIICWYAINSNHAKSS